MAVTAENRGGLSKPARGLMEIVDFATRSHGRAAIVLVVVTLLSILPGFFAIAPTDRDESRFAQATKQMLETGDFIDIRFQETTRYKKPVGIYWLQASVVKAAQALGKRNAITTIWLYRIPSLLGAIGAVLLTYWAALAFLSRRAAVLAALMMATCLLLSIEGRIAKTDATLLFTAVAVMGAMARAYLPEQRSRLEGRSAWTVPAIFWTALAASVLLKGPVIPLIVFLTVVTLVIADRSIKWIFALRPIIGVAWFLVLVLPWFVAITMRAGEGFFAESVGQDLFSKLFEGQESHGAPPGYYLLLFWMTFWPGATLAAMAAPAVFATRHEPGAKFLLAWVVPAWVLFELVVTKLPHYVLPLYPAIAILISGVVAARALPAKSWLEQGTIWWFIVPVLLGLVGLVGLIFIGRQFGFLAWLLVGASIVMGFRAWQLYRSDGAEHSLMRAAVAALLMVTAIFGLIVPSLHSVFPSVALAKVMRDSGCRAPVAAAAGYGEASLVFLAGTATRQTDGAGAADFLRGGECRFAFVETRQERNFAQRADAIGLLYSSGPRFEGFNMGNGRAVTIAVYRSGSPAVSAPPMAQETPSRLRRVRRNIAIALIGLVRPPRAGATPIWRAYARLAIGAAVAIAALILIMVFVDVPAIQAAKQSPAWLVSAFRFVTDLGLAGWFLVPLGTALIVIALVTSPSLTRMSQLVLASLSVRLGFLFLAIALPGLVVTVVKRIVGRARPIVAGEDAFLYKFFLWRVEYASFPSGHATTAFAAAIAFGALWPRLRPLLWTYAIVIALSRVIVTAHHPSDVVAGAIAGAVGALLVRDWLAARRLAFSVRADGAVVALPGPSWARIKRVARSLSGQ